MGNWWLDEEPYPGPTHHPSFEEVKAFLEAAFRGVSGGVTTFFTSLTTEVDRVSKLILQYQPTYFTAYPRKPWEEMTVDERMEYALNLRKNRNTGPRPEWQFSRDGRKDY